MPPRRSKSIPKGLRQLLRKRERVSQVELADAIIPHLEQGRQFIVFDEQRLWRYEPNAGVYVIVEDAEVTNFIFDLDGAQTLRGRFHISDQLAASVLRVIKTRLAKKGFFFTPPEGVCVSNGFLAIEGDKVTLQSPSQDHRQQSCLEIRYNPKADASATDKFLLETFEGDQSMADLIYEIIGVAIFGFGTRYHVVFVFCGEGANGKGVIVQLIQMLIPNGMRSSVSPSQMNLDYQLFPLAGSRFNAVGELAVLDNRNLQALKSICAGDTITVRRVRETGFEVKPRALHVFSTNRLPRLMETGEAVLRRFRLVKFPRVVPENERNPKLVDELFEQGAQGLLRRAVEGFERVLQNAGFSYPEPVRVATLAWVHRSDPVRVFAKMQLVQTGKPKDRIAASDMFQRCCEFCAKASLPIPSSEKDLHSSLEALNFSTKKSNNVYWIGVKFRDAP